MMEPGTVYYRDYISGIKTGSLPEAGKCVVSTASQDGYNYLCVILGAPTEDANGESYDYNMAFYDTVHLYDWAFENFSNLTMLDPETPINEAKVKYGKDQDFVHVAPQEKFTALLPSYVTEEDVQKIASFRKNRWPPLSMKGMWWALSNSSLKTKPLGKSLW